MASSRILRRWLAPAVVSGVALGVAACGGSSRNPGGTPSTPGTPAPVDVGSPLYVAERAPAPAKPAYGPEPIVVQQATIQFDEKISLATQIDGEIEMIATPLARDGKYDPKDPQYYGRLVPRPREKSWMHVRLVEGDLIKEAQTLAFLDDTQTTLQLSGLKSSMEATKKSAEEGENAVREVESALKLTESVPGVAKMEVIKYKVEQAQSRITAARTYVELAKYKSDYDTTKDKWQRHYLQSPFNGRVVKILKSPGEFVKAGEPILEVQNTGRFRVEGKMDRQEAERLKPYTPVEVEPIRSFSPEPFTARHRGEVTGVAVTAHQARPMVVSASSDGTALVWDVTTPEKRQHILPHPSGIAVRAVAATGRKGGPQLVATGGSDGRVRVWDVTTPAQLPDKPTAEFEDAHSQAITAVAFSPDARYLATAAGRDVYLWDVETRKRKYVLPVEHKDDVKAMRFTPQATLVTVCRDRTVRVWAIGSEGANVSRTLDYRSGAVDVLGVSADGGKVLFDQEATRIDLVNLADGRTTGSLMNTGGGMRFAGLALFSGDDKFVVTGAGDADSKGELQLWAAPDGGRGSERRRLVTQYRAAVTCAAFSTDPANKFVAVGTQTGAVHFWLLPESSEPTALKGRVVSITPNDARTVQVRVEVENPDGKFTDLLQDRGAATIIIDPTAKPVPPTIPPQPPQPLPTLTGSVKPLDEGVRQASGVAGK